MFVAPTPRFLVDELGRELAVRGTDGQQLQPADPFGGTVLIGVDVCRPGGNHRTPSRQHAGERRDVCTGAIEHREGLSLLTEVRLEDFLQPDRINILAVGDLVAAVGIGDGGEHLGVYACVVVARESAEVRVVKLHGASLSHRCSELFDAVSSAMK